MVNKGCFGRGSICFFNFIIMIAYSSVAHTGLIICALFTCLFTFNVSLANINLGRRSLFVNKGMINLPPSLRL